MDDRLMTRFVAVTDSPAGDELDIECSVLVGMRVERVATSSHAELIPALKEADAVLCMHTPIDRTVIGALQRCKVIVRFGTGLDNIDRNAAAEAGIPVVGVHDYCTHEVADHTLALLLNWNRKIRDYHQFVVSKRWNERSQTTGNWGCGPLSRLAGQSLGLIGFGRIGQAVALRARAFGMHVLAWSRHPGHAVAEELNVELTERNDLLHRSDVASLHVPLSDETYHLMDAKALELMRPGAVLINTARGALVDEDALVQALHSGHVGGALLDVYEHAPLPANHPLRSFSNVIFTPHVAFYSEDALAELRRKAAEAVLQYLT
jgi:D-3-phosphoglycerate dehydrogenase / 2-oxoglutarate reductase